MMGPIAVLLIAASAGYLVLARATDKTGWVKGLGFALGLLTIGVSLISMVLIPMQMRSMQASGGMMGGMGGRPPMAGQFKPPQFPPPQGSAPAAPPWKEKMPAPAPETGSTGK